MAIQDIQQNPQDTSNFYLSNIYQTLADPNRSNTPTSPPHSPPPFSPPTHAVWVNALWFSSLVISLTCALLATLLQQWARRYLKITQSPRYSPHKRARIRTFFSEGVEKCLLPLTVDALPTLLHISLFLFFAGLIVFLCNVNLTIFKLVLSWVGLCVAFYGCITCMPIIRHDSPYYTPLSLPAWQIVTGAQFSIYWFLQWFTRPFRFRYDAFDFAFDRFRLLKKSYRIFLAQGMQKTAEETALKSPSGIDARAFMWTYECLDEDNELERFFSGLPGFRTSDLVRDPLPGLTEEEKLKLYDGLLGLVERTFSSDLLLAPVKDRRALICAKAVDLEHTPIVNKHYIIEKIAKKYQHGGAVATGLAKVFQSSGHDAMIWPAKLTIYNVISSSQPRDDAWYKVASIEMGLAEAHLRQYAADGDSLSLVILIYFLRKLFAHCRHRSVYALEDLSRVLDTASSFNPKKTSLDLQHEFCTLWNQIVKEAKAFYGYDRYDRYMALNVFFFTLGPIRSIYLSLHQGTDSVPKGFSTGASIYDDPSSYPLCKVPDHCSNLDHHPYATAHTHDNHVSAISTPAVSDDHNIPASVPILTSPDSPSSSTHAPIPFEEILEYALPPNNQTSVPVLPQVIGPTTTEGSRTPTISVSPITTCAMYSTLARSLTSGPPPKSNAAASLSDDAPVEHTVLGCAASDDLNVQLPPFPMSVVRAILPTGLLLFRGCDSI